MWWTGDNVDLRGSIQSMVDSGLHHLKPYVHSDCGGDYRKDAGDLLRWTAHCTFGTILRFHGEDHRPWGYDDHALQTIKSYLQVRYRLIPSLIAAGHEAALTGFPLVARGDLFWPQYPEAKSNDQYIHLRDTLVAPIWDSTANSTSRSVWVPPGEWQDAWDGKVVVGPSVIVATQPYERLPMWHRRGGLMIMVDDGKLRVDSQDWSTLTLQTFPDFSSSSVSTRSVYSQSQIASVSSDKLHTGLTMTTTPVTNTTGTVTIDITASNDKVSRGWIVRTHLLLPIQRVTRALLDGIDIKVIHIAASDSSMLRTPPAFGVTGTAPAVGNVAETMITSSSQARRIVFTVSEN